MKILIADDDIELRELIGFALRQAGYLVVQAADGVEALRVFDEEQPDLVILDIRMEGGDVGLKILQLMRLNPATKQLPVIVCSADGWLLEEQQERLRDRGCEMVEKPFDVDELLRKIRQMVGRAPV